MDAVLTSQWQCTHRADPVPRTKFGHLPIRYNANSDSIFNLTLSEDVETNSGPTFSSHPSHSSANNSYNAETTLSIYHQNVRSLKNKLDCLHSNLLSNLHPLGNYRIFALTETWLSPDVTDAEVT